MLGNRSCFKRIKQKKTWQDSVTNCEIMGGSLARILSVSEQDRLNANILNSEEAWIGLNDVFNEGFYVWKDGSSLVYVNWGASEAVKNASLQREHDCVAASTRFWETANCIEKKPSVCFMSASLGMSNDAIRSLFYCVTSIDYDECYNNTNNCHVNSTCENTLSSYNCICNPGFTGSGTTCKG